MKNDLIVASKEIGPKMLIQLSIFPRDQNAARIHVVNIANNSLKGWKCSNIWEQT